MEELELCLCVGGKSASNEVFYVFPLKEKSSTIDSYSDDVAAGTGMLLLSQDHDLLHRENETETINKINPLLSFPRSPNQHRVGEFVVLNSTIYFVYTSEFIDQRSGMLVACRRLFYCDLLHQSHLGWKQTSGFPARQLDPLPVVVDHVIYLIGGKTATEPIIQAFSPTTNQWTRLNSPPLQCWLQDTHGLPSTYAVVDNPKRIILTTSLPKTFYIYYVNGDFWSVNPFVPTYQPLPQIRGRAAVIGQTMYWFDYYFKLIAFDLEDNRWIRGRIKGLPKKESLSSNESPILLNHAINCSGGDMLILLWTTIVAEYPVLPSRNSDSDSDDLDSNREWYIHHRRLMEPHKRRKHIHCAMIRVSKIIPQVKGKYGLKAFVESCQCFEVDDQVLLSDAFLMLETKGQEEAKESGEQSGRV